MRLGVSTTDIVLSWFLTAVRIMYYFLNVGLGNRLANGYLLVQPADQVPGVQRLFVVLYQRGVGEEKKHIMVVGGLLLKSVYTAALGGQA